MTYMCWTGTLMWFKQTRLWHHCDTTKNYWYNRLWMYGSVLNLYWIHGSMVDPWIRVLVFTMWNMLHTCSDTSLYTLDTHIHPFAARGVYGYCYQIILYLKTSYFMLNFTIDMCNSHHVICYLHLFCNVTSCSIPMVFQVLLLSLQLPVYREAASYLRN